MCRSWIVFALTFALSAAAMAQEPAPAPPAPPQEVVQLDCRLAPDDLVRALGAAKDATPESLLAATLEGLRARLPDATITPRRDLGFNVELALGERTLDAVRGLIESRGGLELRSVADGDYVSRTVRFDLRKEKERLAKWLDGDGRAQLATDPRAIRRFNADAEQGPLAYPHIAWYPRVIRPSRTNTERWGSGAYANDATLGPASVIVFEAKDWNGGVVPEEVRRKPAKERCLLELVALNLHEPFFTGADLDAAGIGVIESETGDPAIAFRLRPARDRDFAEWTAKHIGKCGAFVVNGFVVSAPCFESRLPGIGILHGDFSKAEAEALAATLTAGPLPVTVEVRAVRRLQATAK